MQDSFHGLCWLPDLLLRLGSGMALPLAQWMVGGSRLSSFPVDAAKQVSSGEAAFAGMRQATSAKHFAPSADRPSAKRQAPSAKRQALCAKRQVLTRQGRSSVRVAVR